MARGSGRPDISVGLLDGPVSTAHPDLVDARLRVVDTGERRGCAVPSSTACAHGTFVAGVLVARRGSAAPAICPGCTLVLRPIFAEAEPGSIPATTPEELSEAIVECVDRRVRILNLSAAMPEPTTRVDRRLEASLDYAARRGALVVAAAGNEGTLGSSAITRHPWVIPVAAYDTQGLPMSQSNLGSSIGKRGLGAPGAYIESLRPGGGSNRLSGTSFAAAFVTGAIALLWSLVPDVTAADMRGTLLRGRRTGIAPPLLDAVGAYQALVHRSRNAEVIVA